MIKALGAGLVGAVVILPWTTWANFTSRTPAEAILETPLFLFTALGLMAFGLWLTERDRWLGVFVAYIAALAIAAHTYLALAVAHWVAIGAGLLLLSRVVPIRWAVVALLVLGLSQSLYAGLQFFRYDPLWWGFEQPPYYVIHGTTGNPKYLGALLSVITPLASGWLLLPLLIGVVLTKSALTAVAVFVGLSLSPGRAWRWTLPLGAVAGGLALWLRGLSADSVYSRIGIWSSALGWLSESWPTWLVGHGPGAWFVEVPFRALAAVPSGFPPELFFQAHNDVVQLLFEAGLVALGLLGLWVWSHRRALMASPMRGAVAALAVQVVGIHPMHLATVGPVAVVVLGLATAETSA